MKVMDFMAMINLFHAAYWIILGYTRPQRECYKYGYSMYY
jgi:hypothetical protein